MTALAKLSVLEIKMLRREKVAALFVVALPVALLFAFGLQPHSTEPSSDLGGLSGAEFIASLGMGIAIAVLGLNLVPAVLAMYREKGILRRLAVTPVGPSRLLLAQVLVNVLAAAVVLGLLLGLGGLVLGSAAPRNVAGFLAAVVLVVAALFAMGVLVAAIAPTGRSGYAIGMVLFFPSLFLGGVYIPRQAMGPTLRHIGDFTPLGAGLASIQDAWLGATPRTLHLVVMAGYALVAGAAAARLFRWE